jgi:hypothetical protein
LERPLPSKPSWAEDSFNRRYTSAREHCPSRILSPKALIHTLVDGFTRLSTQQDVDDLAEHVVKVAEIGTPVGRFKKFVYALD